MLPKSFSGFCFGFIHAVALACAAISVYFFFSSSIEYVAGAMILLGAAVAFEIIAALVTDDKAAHT